MPQARLKLPHFTYSRAAQRLGSRSKRDLMLQVSRYSKRAAELIAPAFTREVRRLKLKTLPDAFRSLAARAPRVRVGRMSFALAVVTPTLATLIYTSLIAAPEFVSESKIAVRAGSDARVPVTNRVSAASSTSGVTTTISGAGAITSTSQDAFIVADYIRGHSIISDIGGKPVIDDIYADQGDWFSRLSKKASAEEIKEYWRWKVTANIDTISSIVTLYVRTYRAEDSRRLSEMILERSEALVNSISERSRQDALRRAEAELQATRERLGQARQALLEFRNKTNQVSPVLSASTIEETINQLTRDRLKLENARATMFGVVSDESPTRRLLDSQIEAINHQIEKLRSALSGQEQPSAIFGQIAGYENLQLEVQFAERLFSIALSEYEQARADQDRQRLYVVRVVTPNSPEQATYPKPIRDTALVFMAALVVWSMIALVVAAVRDHTM